MSHTTSIGLTSISQWWTIILAVLEYVESFRNNPAIPNAQQRNAISRLNHFVNCVGEGVLIEEGKPRARPEIPFAEATSNLWTAKMIFNRLPEQPTTSKLIKARLRTHRRLLSYMKNGKPVPRDKLLHLCDFLQEFARQAQSAHEALVP